LHGEHRPPGGLGQDPTGRNGPISSGEIANRGPDIARAHPDRIQLEGGIRLVRGALDDPGQQHITGAAVGEPLSRRAEQRGIGEETQFFLGRDRPGQIQPGKIQSVHQPGRVAEQVADRHRVPARRAPVKPAVHGVVDRQLAAVRQQQDGRRGELLGDRGDLETRA
jgi:hypothetical protein